MKMPISHFGSITQNLRLISGLILFAFAATLFLNHAIGLVQLEAMYDFQQWRWVVTRSWPGTIVLGGALLTHFTLGLFKLANRSTLRLPAWELLQISLGLVIPVLLFPHIVDTRIASTFFGVHDNYLYELAKLWPGGALAQSTLLLIVWIHGCIGIHYWLRLHRTYHLLRHVLLVIAIVIPVSGLAGFMIAGRAVAFTMAEREIAEQIRAVTHWPSPEVEAALDAYRLSARLGFLFVVLIVAAYMLLHRFRMLAAPKIVISYAGGPSVRTAVGPTLLEISRANRVAHSAACGGRARCTTCRVRIDEGADGLKPPKPDEEAILATIGAPKDTRLACQLRPQASLTVTRLSGGPNATADAAAKEEPEAAGVERALALLSVGMSDSVELLRGRLPYDVVFILNEFLAGVGVAITENEGRIDKFFGDWALALFGERSGLEAGCRQTLHAARAIDLAIDRLNEKVSAEIGRPIKCAIGIHAGKVVLGRIGFGKASELTAVGGAVRIATYLQALAQKSGHQIVISAEAARAAALPVAGEMQTISLGPSDGNVEKIQVFPISRGKDLPIDAPFAAREATT